MGTIGLSGDSRGWLVHPEPTDNELRAMGEPGAIMPFEVSARVERIKAQRRAEWEALAENT